MTYEQFYFWLDGYLDCGNENAHDALDDIMEKLKTVNQPRITINSGFVKCAPLTNCS